MTSIAAQDRPVTVGVDTHRDFHLAGVIDERGAELAAESFATDTAGYVALESWAQTFGPVDRFGIEGTGSWGSGLARHLMANGQVVVEVDRPDRAQRRRAGKDDTLDAFAAARAAQSGRATAIAKTGDGPVETIRVLRLARNGAVKAATEAANQLHALVATAPDPLRAELRNLTLKALTQRCARYPVTQPDTVESATRAALRSIARRYKELRAEADHLYRQLETLTNTTAPGLVAMVGIGADVAAQLLITAGDNPDRLRSEAAFARLCGVAPIPASSGQTNRHRLHRGGDRQANAALHRAVIVRLRCDPETRAYRDRRLTEGKTKREIIRCLKRYLARRVHHELTQLQLDAI